MARETDPGSWQRGNRYFRDGHARLEQVGRLPDGGVLLTGSCRGTQFEPYRQQIVIRPDGQDKMLDGDCTCPVEFNCKHVVALVLTWQASTLRGPVGRDEVADWLAELPGDVDPAAGSPEALLYLLDRKPGPGSDLEFKFSIARLKKDGTWGKGRLIYPSSIHNSWNQPNYLRPIDEEILSLIRASRHHHWTQQFAASGAAGHLALIRMAESGRAFWGLERHGPFQPGEPRELELSWTGKQRNGYRLRLSIRGGGLLVPSEPPCYVDSESLTIGTLELPAGVDNRRLEWLRRAPVVPVAQAQDLSHKLALTMPEIATPVEVEYENIDDPPSGWLSVEFDPARAGPACASLKYKYDGLLVSPDHPQTEIVAESDRRLLRFHRDPDAERKIRQALFETGLASIDEKSFRMAGELEGTALRDAWLAWLQTSAPGLRAAGWQIERGGERGFTVSESDGIDGEIENQGNDWFSLRFDLECDGRKMPLLPLVSQLLQKYRPGDLPETLYLDTGEGHYVSVPARQIEPVLKTIVDLYDRVGEDTLELARPDATRLLDLEGIPVRGATSLKELARKLADFSGLQAVELPTTFKGQLREYQQHGLDWLQFLREYGFGGILADDMGLGKTVQTLAHLAVEKRAGRMQHPSLIVAPTSLMGNWRREAALFTPGLEVLILHGPDRSDDFGRLTDFDLVMTTYPLLPRDREVLLQQPWHCLILDEAQQIKNPRAHAAQVVRKLNCGQRLCLTGTPMENHLGELWAQFDFLMPGFLGNRESFTRNYRTPIEKHNDSDRLERLNRRIAPFLLRRTKDLVATELPPKTELLRQAKFDAKQARLYESIRLTMEKKVRNAIAAKGLARSHIIVLEALLKLRQVCCDPRLLPKGMPGSSGTPSAKFNLLFDLLPELLEEGRRVLLFSQFTTMLGLIETELDKRGIAYAKLTGQTRKRDVAIQRFRDGEVALFLVSLKAGGVGLNLVEADTVIHYDPWWNPAVEHQATDRAHRIGQDKPVFIYKLVTEGTVEEKILALQARKQKLAEGVYGSGRKSNEPPIDEATIRALLSGD
ncbi:MAG: DEAD/DEAH box helicase [Xanthomonadales bacterium]|nr:DEAD/DEAH box helicase [Xanthomonadales bacterium]